MKQIEVTSLSSKGQVVIPRDIRKELGISTGDKLIVLTDGDNLLLKRIPTPKTETFKKLIKASRKIIKENGLKLSDVNKAIKQVRRESSS